MHEAAFSKDGATLETHVVAVRDGALADKSPQGVGVESAGAVPPLGAAASSMLTVPVSASRTDDPVTYETSDTAVVATLERWKPARQPFTADFTRTYRPVPAADDAQPTLAMARPITSAPPAAGPFDVELGRELAAGGMGRVLLAVQPSLSREVAVKTILAGGSAGAAQALENEARVLGMLDHPGIVPIHGLGRDPSGRPLVIMKRVEGASLRDLLKDPAHPLWSDWDDDSADRLVARIGILMRVCDAVHFANNRGIVHRDIKPANIMVGELGQVYLLDWGIAVTAGEVGSLAGSPAYMAPEMALGDAVDARTDVYLLGATLHHLLSGSPRHAGESLDETLLAACRSAPFAYDPSIPEDLAALANRATAADPAHRPQGALALRRALADRSATAPRTPFAARRPSVSTSSIVVGGAPTRRRATSRRSSDSPPRPASASRRR